MSETSTPNRAAEFRCAVATLDLPALGPEIRPGVLTAPALERVLVDFFARVPQATVRREALRCAAFLWHDHLEPAHALAQAITSPDGSLLHGIMHRREPDYANAKYWFRRAGRHPAYPVLATRAAAFLQAQGEPALATRLVPGGEWDPFAFVDACEATTGRANADPQTRLLREIQRIEFEAMVEHLLAPDG